MTGRYTRRSSLFASSALVLSSALGCGAAQAAGSIPAYVEAAVHDPARVPDDVMRDSVRKPADLVAFSGVKPGDKVVDFMPGGGYYTRILSPLVGAKGHVYALVPYTLSPISPNTPMSRRFGKS